MTEHLIDEKTFLDDVRIEETPKWQMPMWLQFFNITDSLVFIIENGKKAGLSAQQMESIVKDEGNYWWSQIPTEIVPEDVTRLVYKDFVIERPNIDTQVEEFDEKSISIADLDRWTNTNRDFFESLDI